MLRHVTPFGLALALLAAPIAAGETLGADQACNSNGEINGTLTDNWRFQVRRADSRLMAQIAGRWRSQTPNGVGGMAETQVTYHTEGTLTFERRTCVSMQGLGTSCPASIGHGYWAAHYSDAQTVFISSNLIVSGYDGVARSGNCSGGYFRFVDRDTTIDSQGLTSRRVQ